MKALTMENASNGGTVYSIPVSDSIQGGDLVANTAQDITVPAGARVAIFACSTDFWLKAGTTAAIPTTFGASDAELNPVSRNVAEGDVLSVIAGEAAKFSVVFFG
jgi:hypothetical protein